MTPKKKKKTTPKKKKTTKSRPPRLYHDAKGFFFITNNNTKRRLPSTMSQSQAQKTIINLSTSREVKRRKAPSKTLAPATSQNDVIKSLVNLASASRYPIVQSQPQAQPPQPPPQQPPPQAPQAPPIIINPPAIRFPNQSIVINPVPGVPVAPVAPAVPLPPAPAPADPLPPAVDVVPPPPAVDVVPPPPAVDVVPPPPAVDVVPPAPAPAVKEEDKRLEEQLEEQWNAINEESKNILNEEQKPDDEDIPGEEDKQGENDEEEEKKVDGFEGRRDIGGILSLLKHNDLKRIAKNFYISDQGNRRDIINRLQIHPEIINQISRSVTDDKNEIVRNLLEAEGNIPIPQKMDMLLSMKQLKNLADRFTIRKSNDKKVLINRLLEVPGLYRKAEAYRRMTGDLYSFLMTDEVSSLEGRGRDSVDKDGLTDRQINKMMEPHKNYLGTIMENEIPTLVSRSRPWNKFGFIVNRDPTHDKTSGLENEGSHWVAWWCDLEDSKSVEFFDSFAEEPSTEMLKGMKTLLEKWGDIDFLPKMKINRIVHQDARSSLCGFHCIRFLMDRMKGKPFKDASGFSDVRNNEAKAKLLKKKFSYLLLNNE